ncbi:zinc finger protein 91-like [Uranotaenia lowii]|uniref:zinc finger protein 91-like n=1 Tax=Uranotaenia lowii TaxID=190385 RepID=UPI00247986AA|nr:zinc finger protein 91-like [Uranotaenia lowii]
MENCDFCFYYDNHRLINTIEDVSSSVRGIIEKHFWFTSNELIELHICSGCQEKLLDFYDFYYQVERVYKERLRKITIDMGSTSTNDEEIDSEITVDEIKIEPCSDHFEESDVNEEDDIEVDSETNFTSETFTECKTTVTSNDCLQSHNINVRETSNEKQFECEICPKKFAKRKFLNAHSLIHQRTEKFSCEKCDKTFTTKYSLKAHVETQHEGLNNFPCDICSKQFKSKGGLRAHLTEQHVDSERVRCTICGQFLKNKSSLRKHMKGHTEASMTIECDICGKRSPTAGALKKHMQYHHENQRTYQCTVCDKSFKRPFALKEHIATHTGEVLYSCEFCDRKFNYSANLSSHRKKVHPEEWVEYQQNKPIFKGTSAASLAADIQCQALDMKLRKCIMCLQPFEELGSIETESSEELKRIVENVYKIAKIEVKPSDGKIGPLCGGCRAKLGYDFDEDAYYEMLSKMYSETSPPNAHAEGTPQPMNPSPPAEYRVDSSTPTILDTTCGTLVVTEFGRDESTDQTSDLKCVICSKVFNFKSTLRLHIRSHHGQTAASTRDLETHKQTRKPRTYECLDCNLSFKLKYDYDKHQAIHNRSNLYQCEVCYKLFKHRSYYLMHRNAKRCKAIPLNLSVNSGTQAKPNCGTLNEVIRNTS